MAKSSVVSESDRILAAIGKARSEHGICTVDDVAEAVGLSHATAHRRLRVLVDEGRIETVGRGGQGGFRCVGERIR